MFNYTLFDYFDGDTENSRDMEFATKLKTGQTFKKSKVVYRVEECDHWDGKGTAIIRMIRYQIPDTATQFVHKCPVKKSHMEKLDKDDVLKMEKAYGKEDAARKIKQWKSGRVKMQSHNKLEIKCPLCECVFWKKNNAVPETVTIDGVMKKKGLKK